MLDYGNLIQRSSDYSVMLAQCDMLIVLAALRQRQYTRAVFRSILVLVHHGANVPTLRDLCDEHPGHLNEEVGEQLLSALTRTVMGDSNRSSYPIARRKYLNIRQLSTIFSSDVPAARRFAESRTSRTTVLPTAPEVDIAKKFLVNLVAALEEDTWREYTPEAYASMPDADSHRSEDIPGPITMRGAVDFIKDNVEAEQRNNLFSSPWLSRFASRLSAEAQAMLPGVSDLAAEHDHDAPDADSESEEKVDDP